MLEPLLFKRHFVEKVWGGRSLEGRPGIELPEGMRVGETWEIVDRPNENSVVARGAFEGRTLRELMQIHADEILGRAPAGKDGRFPLLVKYIDACENLSVQVHPDEEAAQRIGGTAEAKTEAWYVLASKPEGVLYCGLRPGVERTAFAGVASDEAVVQHMARWDVAAGDCLFVPGGTVHAIGAGVTILEVQQNSDTTYRIWDWGREGRETHVREALQSIRFGEKPHGPAAPAWEGPGVERGEGFERVPLAASDFFRMSALRVRGSSLRPADGTFRIHAVTTGAGALMVEGRPGEWPLRPGDVWLVPAVCGYHRLEAGPEGLETIEMTSPPA